MPRRNLYLLIAVATISVLCYHKVQKNRYGLILLDVMNQIERRYVEPVRGESLFEGAMEGMTEKLDQYSGYIPPKRVSEFQEALDNEFGGVGMEVSLDPKGNHLMVLSPIPGSPASEAGIRAGDRILRIDAQSTSGMTLKDAVAHMRGKPGQPVVLSVQHEGESKPIDVTVVRAVIHVDSVLGDSRNADGSWNYFLQGHPGIGYLRLTTFGDRTTKELTAALDWLRQHHMQGLILDLRNNPGGRLEQATAVCDLFVKSGVIVSTRGRNGQPRSMVTADGRALDNFPMAVLVNQYSASASEIVAACLQDHGRAVIVGQRTLGKGTVQELIDLGEGLGTLKLTTASYWRPSGRNIHRTKDASDKDDWGVMPDKGYEVLMDANEAGKWARWRVFRDARRGTAEKPQPDGKDDLKGFVDRPLAKAVEYLEQSAKK